MADLRVLVAAAGRGTRAGLTYPKTLFQIHNKPILVHIHTLLAPYDAHPTLIVSPDGKGPIQECLSHYGLEAHLVVQPEPLGMGDAVLCFEQSPSLTQAEHILLVWGDIPFIQSTTVASLVNEHFINKNHFTFATRQVKSAYTQVSRNAAGQVVGVIESREQGLSKSQSGERDIGLFIFQKTSVLEMLREEVEGKWGKATGEHGFLYIIGHLAARGFRVAALPIATELDLVSLNCLQDVEAYL